MGIQYEKNAVVITEAPAMNYFGNHVRLPKDYGTPAYDARPDVKAIKQTVRKSLDDLDAATGWKSARTRKDTAAGRIGSNSNWENGRTRRRPSNTSRSTAKPTTSKWIPILS